MIGAYLVIRGFKLTRPSRKPCRRRSSREVAVELTEAAPAHDVGNILYTSPFGLAIFSDLIQIGMRDKPMKVVFATALLLVSVSQAFAAEYFLKFEASGSTIGATDSVLSSSVTWLKLSIVEGFPTDGPIHFKRTRTGSYTKYVESNRQKALGVDNVYFYVADVPRSIMLTRLSDGSKEEIKHGQAPKTYANGPAFLMEDGLLVAPGISFDDSSGSEVYKVFVAATMPVVTAFGHHEIDPSGFSPDSITINPDECAQGWFQSGVDGNGVIMVQAINRDTNTRCIKRAMYSGYITHIVREE